eukprot:5190062-Amphidinium_carterae.1
MKPYHGPYCFIRGGLGGVQNYGVDRGVHMTPVCGTQQNNAKTNKQNFKGGRNGKRGETTLPICHPDRCRSSPPSKTD